LTIRRDGQSLKQYLSLTLLSALARQLSRKLAILVKDFQNPICDIKLSFFDTTDQIMFAKTFKTNEL